MKKFFTLLTLLPWILLPNIAHSTFIKKLQGIPKIRKEQCEAKKQASEPDLGIILIWKILDREFKVSMVHKLRVLWKKWTTCKTGSII